MSGILSHLAPHTIWGKGSACCIRGHALFFKLINYVWSIQECNLFEGVSI